MSGAAGRWDIGEYGRLAEIASAAVARFVEESQSGAVPVGSPPPLPDLIAELRLRELVHGERLDEDRFEPWLDGCARPQRAAPSPE